MSVNNSLGGTRFATSVYFKYNLLHTAMRKHGPPKTKFNNLDGVIIDGPAPARHAYTEKGQMNGASATQKAPIVILSGTPMRR